VLARFHEEGESAKTSDRTELKKLLELTCGSNRRSINGSACRRCFFLRELRSMVRGLIEPP
jgi:hypothetical protein